MTDTARAVERLTQTHTVHLDGAEYECAPLLEQLRDAISSSMGGGSGGGGGAGGNLINAEALGLWQHIEDIARAWLNEWRLPHAGDLINVVPRFAQATQAQHAAGAIDDDMRDELDAAFGKWIYRIEDLFDPPHQKELTAPCPSCGERHHLSQEKDKQGRVIETRQLAAVTIPVKRGRAVIAECRCCGAMWSTETELVALAEAMGIEVDVVALRALAAAPLEDVFAT
ncbi:hypothetical protein [Leucobacter sp. G161]|uniref:DUF7341 domain-containing protein n=1 Tax=Leucobacter sp. G161 TaxID=663704 RepID=UPI00073BECF3|nr:hypothetical protein [Leucobacter sp. G161]KUF07171.1 hypothetical protein AUL38_02460 [Leucobacter sp. G161]